MKCLSHICGRFALIFLLAAFLSTTAMAGFSQLGLSCCGECCAPKAHHPVGMAKVKLSSAMPMNCCGGVSNQPCDLSTQPSSRDAHQYLGITPTIDGSPAAAIGGQILRASASSLMLKNPPMVTDFPETIPIYLEHQAFLI